MSTSAATTPNAIFAQHLRQAMNGVELAPSASTVGASNGTLKALGAMKSPNPGSPVNGQSSKMGKASVNPLKRKASATASSSPAVGAATAAGESPKAPVAPVKLEATARAAEPSHGGRIDGKVWLAQQVDRMEAALKEAVYQRALVLRYHAEVRQQNVLHLTHDARTPVAMREAYLKACREWQETSRRVKTYMERCRETYQPPAPVQLADVTLVDAATDLKPALSASTSLSTSATNGDAGADATHAIDVDGDEQEVAARRAEPIVIDVEDDEDKPGAEVRAGVTAADGSGDATAKGSRRDTPTTNGLGTEALSSASVAQSQPIVVDDMQGSSAANASGLMQDVPGAIPPGMELTADPTIGTADFDFFDFDMDDGGGGGEVAQFGQSGNLAQPPTAESAAATVAALQAVMSGVPTAQDTVVVPSQAEPAAAAPTAPAKQPSVPPSDPPTSTAPPPTLASAPPAPPAAPAEQPAQASGPPSYGITPPAGFADGLGADFDFAGQHDLANMDLSQYSELFGYGDLAGMGDDAMGDFGASMDGLNATSYLDAGQT